MSTSKHRTNALTRHTPKPSESQAALNQTDPRVRLLALMLATRDDEVRQGSIPKESANQVPPTIARAIASLLLEIGKDPTLTRDLIASIGTELGDPAFSKRYAAFITGVSEQLKLAMPVDPLAGHTVAVQRRAQKIVVDEAAAVRRKSSSDLLASPLQRNTAPAAKEAPAKAPEPFPTTRRASGTGRTNRQSNIPAPQKTTSKSIAHAAPPKATVSVPAPKPKALSEITDQMIAATIRRMAIAHGPGFDKIAALEVALEGFQAATAADKHRSSANRDLESMRDFEGRCGEMFTIMREEAVLLGAANESFNADDLHRILKTLVQKLGLVIEMGGGHVRLKDNGKKKPHR